jgi:Family of unknown function (DUF6498)
VSAPSTAGPVTADGLSRALALYRRTAASRSAVVLLAANAVPLVGVLFFGWSLWTILVLYWVENGIVGLWNVPKIILAQGSVIPQIPELPPEAALAATGNAAQAAVLRSAWQQARGARARQLAGDATTGAGGPKLGGLGGVGRAALAAFFCVHYGMFWFVHGVFIYALPLFLGGAGTCGVLPEGPPIGLDPGFVPQCGNAFGTISWPSVWIAAGALFLSHGASFLFNYIGRGESLTASPGGQMAAPYARVVILHLTIILGAFVVAFLGSPIGALVVLVALKTAFDLGLHLRERGRADSAWARTAATGRASAASPVLPGPSPQT